MNGFTGVFCENKQESDHLLFLHDTNAMILSINLTSFSHLNNNRKQIAHELGINSALQTFSPISIYQSCSTVFNGVSLIFGGSRAPRQVFILLTQSLFLEIHEKDTR